MAAYGMILAETQGRVGVIRLNRPQALNALCDQLMDELGQALLAFDADDSVGAIVLTGAGRAFCVGVDLGGYGAAPGNDGYDPARDMLGNQEHMSRLILKLRDTPQPVIAAVNGPAAGAGLSLACACDLRIASDAATFVPGFIGIGLIPDSGGSYFVHRLLGNARAFEWMTSNRRLSAAEAHAWGLVNEVVEADALLARAHEVAQLYASLPTRGIGMTKRLFDHADTATLEEQLALEAQLQQAATRTSDFREGVNAFLEKRPPTFSGD
jgi:2-(1,2-epoxy-1,2-dihydrophenyl)acetyl-CoA isomerase